MTIITESIKDIVPLIKKGGVGIIPTDTIYGIVALALKKGSVERIFEIKKRNPEKPLIILIPSKSYLDKFSIKLNEAQNEALAQVLDKGSATSFILPCSSKKFEYLHRGKQSLAFRIPKNKELLSLLRQVGPLVAPSANYEGELPAQNIEIARQYFGESVDFYLNGGQKQSKASAVIRINEDGSKEFVRQN